MVQRRFKGPPGQPPTTEECSQTLLDHCPFMGTGSQHILSQILTVLINSDYSKKQYLPLCKFYSVILFCFCFVFLFVLFCFWLWFLVPKPGIKPGTFQIFSERFLNKDPFIEAASYKINTEGTLWSMKEIVYIQGINLDFYNLGMVT